MIRGELPARFVWRDERVVAFMAQAPLAPGHVLVVPRQEVDYWIELEPELLLHVMTVAQHVGRAIQQAFRPVKVGMVIAGVEVRHVHLHLSPISSVRDLDFTHQDPGVDPESLDRDANAVRAALRELGHADVVPEPAPGAAGRA